MAGPTVNVLGRLADRVPVGSARLHAAEIEKLVLTGVSGCLGYQVVIDTDPAGRDAVTVRLDLLPQAGDPAAVREAMAARFRERCGTGADVVVTSALDPVTTTGSFVSWKAARIQDNRLTEDRERAVAQSVAHRYAFTT
jgi:phenylacetate-CoA ligase